MQPKNVAFHPSKSLAHEHGSVLNEPLGTTHDRSDKCNEAVQTGLGELQKLCRSKNGRQSSRQEFAHHIQEGELNTFLSCAHSQISDHTHTFESEWRLVLLILSSIALVRTRFSHIAYEAEDGIVYLGKVNFRSSLPKAQTSWFLVRGRPTGMVVANRAVDSPFFLTRICPWALGPKKRCTCFATKVSPTPLIINVAFECWLGWVYMVAPATQSR